MAHKKAGGSTRNGRDSKPKYLGLKKFGSESVVAGNIIVRQRGTRYRPDTHVGIGRDHTLYALIDGKVLFTARTRKGQKRVFVSVQPNEVQS